MDEPRVFNRKHHDAPADATYVGRPTKWGNPFVIGRDGDRAEVVAKYDEWLTGTGMLMADIGELVGKDLVCWCAPEQCHADVLLAHAARYEERYQEAALEVAMIEADQ